MTGTEQQLWDEMKRLTNNDTAHWVPITDIEVNHLSVPGDVTVEMVRDWRARGLVVTNDRATWVRLSCVGQDLDQIDNQPTRYADTTTDD